MTISHVFFAQVYVHLPHTYIMQIILEFLPFDFCVPKM
jgi:hypothetical protein